MADQGTEGLLSPFLRWRRIAAAKPILQGRVLDVGCGSGALAGLLPPESYVGVEIDAHSLEVAKQNFPRHSFLSSLPAKDEKFDTIAALAVIEHVPDPASFLADLAARLAPGRESCIVCTTPSPSMDWIHSLGARLGLFSRHAHEEHETLLGQSELKTVATKANLGLGSYRKFLLGANQLVVFQFPENPSS
jgi:2-polyprenyl-3-methyl-5-hydroxy-6-metoxy-1,4-benzoquinol methylase